MLLQDLRELAYRAHTGTSFSPDKRADSIVKDYSEELEADIKKLQDEKADEETVTNYTARYRSMISSWLSAKSNCISSMITGPSNFPVRRAEKANASESNRYNEFRQWREKALKAIGKQLNPVTTMSELERYKKDLKERTDTQELMKVVNAAYLKYKKKPESLEQVEGLSDKAKDVIRTWVPQYGYERVPFQPYQLQNNLANIKRIQGRIVELERKEVLATTVKEKEFPFDGGVVILNFTEDRLQIKHDSKPERDVIQKMKDNGYRWAPSQGCWQRQLTNNAIYSLRFAIGMELTVTKETAAAA